MPPMELNPDTGMTASGCHNYNLLTVDKPPFFVSKAASFLSQIQALGYK